MSEQAPTRVLRRALEQALETRLASSVLFEAISAAGDRVPRTVDDVLRIVRGPLRTALERRLGAHEAEELVIRIVAQLEPVADDLRTQERPLDELAAQTRREDATTAFPTADRAVPVLVVAAGRGFENRIAVALGEQRAAPRTVSGREGLRRAVEAHPPIVVVDASDFPALETSHLLAATSVLPVTTACVLWGSDLPYGRNLARSIAAQSRPWMTLDLREGIAPFLDLVRSRRRSRSP